MNAYESLRAKQDEARERRNQESKQDTVYAPAERNFVVIRKHGVICSCCKVEIRHEVIDYHGKAMPDAVKVAEGEIVCGSCYTAKKKICVICSTPFWSKVNNKKTCSPDCAIAHYRVRQKNNQKEYREAFKSAVSFDFKGE